MRIAVVGLGHMGSWLIRELSEDHEVAGYDKDREKREAVEGGLRLDTAAAIEQFAPEIVINAVSLQHTIEAFEEVLPYLPSECILVDIASVKGDLLSYYRECGSRYASIHPMFGPRFTKFDDLKEENAIIIKESDATAKEFFKAFFRTRGIQVYECPFDEHDRVMADSLALPFFLSLVFAAAIPEITVPGTTFKRHEEVAKKLLMEDPHLLTEVLFTSHSFAELEKIIAQVELFKEMLMRKKYTEFRTFLETLRKKI